MKKWIKWVGVMSGRHARWGSLESGNNGMGWVDVGAGREHNGEGWYGSMGMGSDNIERNGHENKYGGMEE